MKYRWKLHLDAPDLPVMGRSGPLRGRRLPHHKARQCLGLVVERILTVAKCVLLFACIPPSSPTRWLAFAFFQAYLLCPRKGMNMRYPNCPKKHSP